MVNSSLACKQWFKEYQRRWGTLYLVLVFAGVGGGVAVNIKTQENSMSKLKVDISNTRDDRYMTFDV